MKNINITVENKRATVVGSPVIICGNSDYTVTFAFDSDWNVTGVRTARFVYVKDGKVQHEDVVFSGNTVAVPILSGIDSVKIGVFAGELRTTTPAVVRCGASILCGSGEVHEPTPDVYDQIMALFNDLAERGGFGATEAQAQQIAQNQADIAALVSGTKKVGNAKTLDGHGASEVGASGARNLIPYPYVKGTNTIAGITWTDNGDGTVTANGTAQTSGSNGSYFFFTQERKVDFPTGTYTLSRNPNNSLYALYIRFYDENGNNVLEKFIPSTAESVTFEVQETYKTYTVAMRIMNGNTVENLTVKPMLELGSVAHDYVPYHFGGAEDAKTVNGFAVYTDVSQLGLSTTATLLEVYNAMPYLSELECASSVLTDASWKFPSTAGTVKIVKINAIRGYLEFRQKTGAAFYWMGLDNSSPSVPDGVWHNIADGGNAQTLDGHGAEYFTPQASLDAVQSQARKDISSAGWYRIAKCDNNYQATCLIALSNMYNTGGCEQHLILFSESYANSGFTTLSSKNTQARIFTKIRHVMEGNTQYFEVYYAFGTTNPCSFTILDFGHSKIIPWKAIEPVATQETVEGVTVKATYDIPANANVATTVDLAKYLPLTGGTVKSKYDRYAIIVEAENADSGASTIRYSLAGTALGEIGISSTNGAFYREGTTNHKLHHDGNSAKVHIGTSAPSDTSALWIDTSA